MRHILLSTTALIALSLSVQAADLPKRTAPAAAPLPVFVWSGFYAGADVGYAWMRDSLTQNDGSAIAFTSRPQPKGALGGVFAGYQMQSGNLVYGVESDVELSGLKGSSTNHYGTEDYYHSVKTNVRGSLRARLGYAFGPALIYATGGVAAASFKTSQTNLDYPADGSHSGKTTRFGWTLGAGVEYKLTSAWSLRTEYRYTDFGSFNRLSDGNRGGGGGLNIGSTANHKVSDQAVRIGIAYSFR